VAPEIVPKLEAVKVAVVPSTPVTLVGLDVIEIAGMNFK
jgi:hypothetical protein